MINKIHENQEFEKGINVRSLSWMHFAKNNLDEYKKIKERNLQRILTDLGRPGE